MQDSAAECVQLLNEVVNSPASWLVVTMTAVSHVPQLVMNRLQLLDVLVEFCDVLTDQLFDFGPVAALVSSKCCGQSEIDQGANAGLTHLQSLKSQ